MRVNFTYTARNDMESAVRSDTEVGPSQIVRTSYAYDAVGRMTNLHHRDNGGASISNFTYTYDAASRVTTEVTNGTTKTYTYDNTDQLTADGTVTVTYDANGNRNNGSYTTGTGNQITGDGTWTYSYDAEGNMTKKSQGASAETWTYGYDQRNQLHLAEKRATDGGTLQMRADYAYDWNGNRIQKAVDSDGDTDIDTTERYAYDGWKTGPQTEFVGNENWDVWADLDDSSSLTSRYLRGDVIDQIFARTDAGTSEAYWLLTDRLGSLRNVVDDTQAVKDNIAYDGFGNVISESDAAYGGRYKFTGREVDVETELQYNRARYYDGAIGRWISRDPLSFDAGDSNLYRYVNNRPTIATDPSGLVIRIYYTRSQPSSQWHVTIAVFDPCETPDSRGFKTVTTFEGIGPGANVGTKIGKLLVSDVFDSLTDKSALARYYANAGRPGYDLINVYNRHLGQFRKATILKYKNNDPGTAWSPTATSFVPVNTGTMTFAQELRLLDSVRQKLRQVPICRATGPNSNSYTAQLLKLASEINSQLAFPTSLSSAPGWNHQNYGRYGPEPALATDFFTKWGTPLARNIQAYINSIILSPGPGLGN